MVIIMILSTVNITAICMFFFRGINVLNTYCAKMWNFLLHQIGFRKCFAFSHVCENATYLVPWNHFPFGKSAFIISYVELDTHFISFLWGLFTNVAEALKQDVYILGHKLPNQSGLHFIGSYAHFTPFVRHTLINHAISLQCYFWQIHMNSGH